MNPGLGRGRLCGEIAAARDARANLCAAADDFRQSGDVVWNAHAHQWDVITDFNPYGSADRDGIDLRLIMDQTQFTGTTAQQAYDQGFLRLSISASTRTATSRTAPSS